MISFSSSCATTALEDLQTHPLENDVILREVFKYCSSTFDSVKNRRLVCKAWKEASDVAWKSFTVPLTILQEDDKEQGSKLDESPTTTLSKFLQQQSVPNKSKFPNRNFVLKNWKIYNKHFARGCGGTTSLNARFWSSCGSNITILTLTGCTLAQSETQFEKCFLAALPNLERLSLLNCAFVIRRSERTARIAPQPRELYLQNEEILPVEPGNYNHVLLRQPQDIFPTEYDYICLVEWRCSLNQRLKSIRVQNVKFKYLCPWSKIMAIFPNLEEISVRFNGNMEDLFASVQKSFVAGKLRKFDIMEISSSAAEMYSESVLQFNWGAVSLQKLKLDCGFRTDAKHIQKILETQSGSLKELHLFRAPFSFPYYSFPCFLAMPRLTELHLWGSIVGSLDFLRLMSKLKVLKWNVSCYDENDNGARVHKYLKRKDLRPEFTKYIVEMTKGLATGFQLDNLTTLEVEWGRVTLQSWQALGTWMPNLKRLKGTVASDEQFAQIGKQWPDIEDLELTHGSRVSPRGILEAVLDNKTLQKLESFAWKPCPCLKKTVGNGNMRDVEEEMYAESALRNLAGRNVLLPWKLHDLVEQQNPADNQHGVCLQNLFEMAITQGGAHVAVFLFALKSQHLSKGKYEMIGVECCNACYFVPI